MCEVFLVCFAAATFFLIPVLPLRCQLVAGVMGTDKKNDIVVLYQDDPEIFKYDK
jgi:hypothetical protein